MKLLIVEDEKKLSAFLKKGLRQEGFYIDQAYTAEECLQKTLDGTHDLIILDINLPDGDGFGILETLRKENQCPPILMLTARESIEDKIRGLEGGANDYVSKPFSFRELVARIRVLLRPPETSSAILTVSNLILDTRSRQIKRQGTVIVLTQKEFSLLEILMRNAGRAVSRVELWEHAWAGEYEVNSNVLDVHIKRLRRKIDQKGLPSLIDTVYGTGYKIEPSSPT